MIVIEQSVIHEHPNCQGAPPVVLTAPPKEEEKHGFRYFVANRKLPVMRTFAFGLSLKIGTIIVTAINGLWALCYALEMLGYEKLGEKKNKWLKVAKVNELL
jgi:hypothetical protein